MLIKFTSPAGASVSMFEKDANALLKMMGHSGTVPSAIRAEDIPQALQQLEQALQTDSASQATPKTDNEDNVGCGKVSTNVRAYPLIQLLKAAISKQKTVMWEYDHGFL